MLATLKRGLEDGSFARGMMKSNGVVCLSRKPLNILMWSHYADKHRGFLLEFRIPHMGPEDEAHLAPQRLVPFPVQYSSGRPCVGLYETDGQVLVDKIALTKSADWKYEAEERVVDHLRGPGIHPYNRDEILCSVVAGQAMKEEHFTTLARVISSLQRSSIPNLTLYRAQRSACKYELEIPDHPRITSGDFEAT